MQSLRSPQHRCTAKVENHRWHHSQWRVRANTSPVTSSCLRTSATCRGEHKDGLFPSCSTSAPERAIWGLHASGMEMFGGSKAPPPELTSNVYAWDVNKRFLQFFYSSVHNVPTHRNKHFTFYLLQLRILWGVVPKLHVLHGKQLVFTWGQESSWESRNTCCTAPHISLPVTSTAPVFIPSHIHKLEEA